MTCSDFIHDFSEYYDGEGSSSFKDRAESHLSSCSDCRRYLKVFDRGRELLRSFGSVDLSEDFGPRLQHRIYHVAEREALARGSGATAATVLGMAVVLVFVAWSPALLRTAPEVQLAPIVVSRPEPRPIGLRPRPRLFPVGRRPQLEDSDFWGWSSDLRFQPSPLNAARGPAAFRKVDFN